MRETLHHRGPDDEGIWQSADGRIAFGHRRLAVIDLSSAGRQPMQDHSGSFFITFNGEIYNYRSLRKELEGRGHSFRTATDTEVILESYAEWGADCLKRLNGMFAFGLYDARQQTLLLARDRAGEKPLFYRTTGRSIAFASELKALFADPDCPRELNREALEFYLAFGYVPGDKCIVTGIRKLPQGCALAFELAGGKITNEPYWQLPARTSDGGLSESELIDELDSRLEEAVRLRLIADVPVGIMLSGGVDSSLITAMAARAAVRVKTFTITFPDDPSHNEAPYARQVADHFATEHIELAAEPASVDILPQLARQFDEPIADSSMVPTYLVSRLIRRDATVALGGDGGDELFGGYPHHSWIQQQTEVGRWLPDFARKAGHAAATQILPTGVKGRNYLVGLMAGAPWNIVQFNVLFDWDTRRRLLGNVGDTSSAVTPEAYKASLCANRQTLLQQSTALDFQTYLVDDILVKVDRSSMLCALETRAPFLDPLMIDFAYRLVPDQLRATSKDRKVLLRRLAARVLPASLDLKRKQGFSLPLSTWFKVGWGKFVEHILLDSGSDLFDRQTVQSLLDHQRAGLSNTHRLFALLMLELWRREYRITIRGREPIDHA